jgi:hypothetical protein
MEMKYLEGSLVDLDESEYLEVDGGIKVVVIFVGIVIFGLTNP